MRATGQGFSAPALREEPSPAASHPTPNLALLHGGMLLSGFGTAFLGPALPALATAVGVTDAGSGLFFTAQFFGAFLGGVTTSKQLWRSLLRGSFAATLGFGLLALCVRAHASLQWTAASLLPLGFGVGQMLTSLNLLAAQRFQSARGSALALVNFSWSLGAVLAPLLLGILLAEAPLGVLLLVIACLFAVAGVSAVWNAPRRPSAGAGEAATSAPRSLGLPAFLYYASLLLLYGGVETALAGWITTFGTRYGAGTLGRSALGAMALWIGITAGRALAARLLRTVRERTLLTLSLLSAIALAAALSLSHGGAAVTALAGLLGVALAPWFPVVLAGMLGEGASATQVGSIIAVSGLGAASLPLLVGTVSHASGSLRLGLLVPLSGLVVLLLMSLRRPEEAAAAETESV